MTLRRGTSCGIIREGGFTLIESMIAMFFLAYIVGQMAMISMYASRSSNLAQRVTRANMLADEAVEKSRNVDYNNLQNGIEDIGEAAGACPITSNVANCTSTIENRFTRVRTVTPLALDESVTPLTSSNKAEVGVTVTFTDALGNPQTLQVSTVVSRY